MVKLIDPTGRGIREYDAMGGGWFRAPRSGKLHNGLDFICGPRQEVVCPVVPGGVLVREAIAYSDTSDYLGVVIDTGELVVTLFYVEPYDKLIGTYVIGGQPIGTAQDITERYGSEMTPHIHMRVLLNNNSYLWQKGGVYINPKLLLI